MHDSIRVVQYYNIRVNVLIFHTRICYLDVSRYVLNINTQFSLFFCCRLFRPFAFCRWPGPGPSVFCSVPSRVYL